MTDYAAELVLVDAAIAANLRRLGAATISDRGRTLEQQSLKELREHRESIQDAIASEADGSGPILRGIAERQR